MRLEINDIYQENKLWFALVHEIINTKCLCNMKIQSETTQFFTSQPNFLFIQDEKGEFIETPMVGYVGQTEKKLEFTYIFGTSKSSGIMGQSFYFTNYENAIGQIRDLTQGVTQGYTQEKTQGKLGIVRSAIFVGKMLLKINDVHDANDESEIKKKRCMEPEYDHKYEGLTMRISDYDATWAQDYDSVYLGQVELDDGTLLKDTPLYALKYFNQQHSLSYHYIGKTGNTIL
jgi:hypothetical protein